MAKSTTHSTHLKILHMISLVALGGSCTSQAQVGKHHGGRSVSRIPLTDPLNLGSGPTFAPQQPQILAGMDPCKAKPREPRDGPCAWRELHLHFNLLNRIILSISKASPVCLVPSVTQAGPLVAGRSKRISTSDRATHSTVVFHCQLKVSQHGEDDLPQRC